MKFTGPAIYGMVAAVATFISTMVQEPYGALLLLFALLMWVLFIVFIVRAIRPE